LQQHQRLRSIFNKITIRWRQPIKTKLYSSDSEAESIILKTGLSLTPDRDKERPMELNFECILERIEFSQFQPHLTLPELAKEILVRLKMRNRKTFPFFIS